MAFRLVDYLPILLMFVLAAGFAVGNIFISQFIGQRKRTRTKMMPYECGMDQPTYSPVQQIIERSGTLFFSFQDLDSTKPAGSVKIRVETITHYLERYATGIIEKKLAASPPGCPLLASRPVLQDPS